LVGAVFRWSQEELKQFSGPLGTHQSRRMEGFTGDGKYPGDGGSELERLWVAHKWKEIRGCPGRYTVKAQELRTKSSLTVVKDLFCAKGDDKGDGNKDNSHSSLIPTIALHARVDKIGKDPIEIVMLRNGGGLLTYQKSRKLCDAKQGDCGETLVHVHTFNTESGLIRKILDIGKADVILNNRGSLGRHTYILTILLSFLESSFRSYCGSTVVRALRHTML